MSKSFLAPPRILGGIHIPHRKSTSDAQTLPLISPSRVLLLMSQHIGKPAKPVVKKGDSVFVGTLVGEADGLISANIHASVSGVVADVCKMPSLSGEQTETVIIDSDGKFTQDPQIRAPKIETAEDLIRAAAQSGVVGLGGAGFPTHVKFQIPQDAAVDTLVINAAECEPYITGDYREMVENTAGIVEGICRIKDLLSIPRAVIGIEQNKPEAIRLLTEKGREYGIEVHSLKESYPQGAEKVLIARLTGRAVPAGGLPADAGVVIVNVSTVGFLAAYFKDGMPLVRRRVTVDGDAIKNPANVWVPVGTQISDIIQACGGYEKPVSKLILGGPMMGLALYSEEAPICKTSGGLLAFSKSAVTLLADNNCIRCGRCNRDCPMSLSPAEIQVAQETGDLRALENLFAADCIECGSCAYVCPARRPVTQHMRLAKEALKKGVKVANGQ